VSDQVVRSVSLRVGNGAGEDSADFDEPNRIVEEP
jgi:hypothetical protein